jgi:hypothetical protein
MHKIAQYTFILSSLRIYFSQPMHSSFAHHSGRIGL